MNFFQNANQNFLRISALPSNKLPGQKSLKFLVGILGETMTDLQLMLEIKQTNQLHLEKVYLSFDHWIVPDICLHTHKKSFDIRIIEIVHPSPEFQSPSQVHSNGSSICRFNAILWHCSTVLAGLARLLLLLIIHHKIAVKSFGLQLNQQQQKR